MSSFSLKDKSADAVRKGIRTFVYRYGAPQKLLSDRGKEFVNHLNEKLAAEFKIQRLVTSPYHPQTNGLDERTNQTLKERLSRLINEKQDDWDQHLEAVAYSMRTQKQATTKFTPFFLMFHCHPNEMNNIKLQGTPDEEDFIIPPTITEDEQEAYISSIREKAAAVKDEVLKILIILRKNRRHSMRKSC